MSGADSNEEGNTMLLHLRDHGGRTRRGSREGGDGNEGGGDSDGG
jgi:hypothetical protein